MSDTSCLFCRVVSGEIPATRVYEDEMAIAFLDLYPVSLGHVLVIPRVHSTSLVDADPMILSKLLPTIQKVAHGLCRALHVQGFNLHQNNGVEAGQTIPHLHFHLIPRRSEDGLQVWEPNPTLSKEARDRKMLAAEIMAAIPASSTEQAP